MSPERKKIFEALPDEFSPVDIRELARQHFPDRYWLHDAAWSRTVIKNFRMDGIVEKVKRGVYQKTEEVTNES
jgi:hypothetical protein